ncbi:MAG: hypothetical protein Q7K42_03105 [Candidatus Diapherotrites archaeon]|nr:hypothetical protein [Candidatus Diapherotrites archaeon]
MNNVKKILILIFILLFLTTNVNATHFSWDHCDGPGQVKNINSWITEWISPTWDSEDWVDIYLSSAGTYQVNLEGPSGTDFDVFAYKSCISGLAGKGDSGSSIEIFQFTISSPGTYHFKIKAYSGSGDWWMYVQKIASSCNSHSSSACLSNDVYWKDSCGTWEDKRYECGDNSYGSWNYVCNGNSVYRQRSATLKGCSSGSCYSNNSTESELYQTCGSAQYCSSGQCKNYVCTKATDCGTTGYNGNNYCYDGDLYRDYAESWCNNPSTTSSSCSNQTQKVKQAECGSTTYGNWSSNYCSSGNIIQNRIITTPGCSSASCTSTNSTETKTIETCSNKNYAEGFEVYCSGSQVKKRQRFHEYSCSSNYGVFCQESTNYYINDQVSENCSYGCSGSACIVPKPNLTISESDIWIEK